MKSSGLARSASSTSTWTTSGTACPGSQGPTSTATAAGPSTPASSPAADRERHPGRGQPRARRRPEVRPLRHPGHLAAGGGEEHARSRAPPTTPTTSPSRRSARRTTTAAAWSASTTASPARRRSSTPGRTVRRLGRGLPQDRRGRHRPTSRTSRPGRTALRQTGRPIHLELSNSLNINDAATWQQYSNGWRTGGDIECYCGPNGSSYPLTDWGNVSVPVRPGRRLAAVRRAGRVQRLRLARGRQRRQRRPDRWTSARPRSACGRWPPRR